MAKLLSLHLLQVKSDKTIEGYNLFSQVGWLDLYANKLTGTMADKQGVPTFIVWRRIPILQSQVKPSLIKGQNIQFSRKTSGAKLNANC